MLHYIALPTFLRAQQADVTQGLALVLIEQMVRPARGVAALAGEQGGVCAVGLRADET
jgi:hypothetical protein